MCLVLDINAFHLFFSKDNQEFNPLKKWIINGSGKLVFGGTKYWNEFKKTNKYNRIIKELRSKNKVVYLDTNAIDNIQKRIDKENKDNAFNDTHILAIFIYSRSRIFCSNDKKSFKFLTDMTWYPNGHSIPKMYSGNLKIVKKLLHNHKVCKYHNASSAHDSFCKC